MDAGNRNLCSTSITNDHWSVDCYSANCRIYSTYLRPQDILCGWVRFFFSLSSSFPFRAQQQWSTRNATYISFNELVLVCQQLCSCHIRTSRGKIKENKLFCNFRTRKTEERIAIRYTKRILLSEEKRLHKMLLFFHLLLLCILLLPVLLHGVP